MEILGDTNLQRDGVMDMKYAKFRTSAARVLDIEFRYPDEHVGEDPPNEVCSTYSDKFKYKKGDLVLEPKYKNTLMNDVCAPGIHFFTTKRAAKHFNYYYPKRKNGKIVEYEQDGALIGKGYKKNGRLHGQYEKWYVDGTPLCEQFWNEGSEVGTWRVWYLNGQLQLISEYKDGAKNGWEYEFSQKGLVLKKALYALGLLHGKYESFYEDGTPNVEANYEYGKRHGLEKLYIISNDGDKYHDVNLFEHGIRKITSCYKNGEKFMQKWFEAGPNGTTIIKTFKDGQVLKVEYE